jgi:hypothetical protein
MGTDRNQLAEYEGIGNKREPIETNREREEKDNNDVIGVGGVDRPEISNFEQPFHGLAQSNRAMIWCCQTLSVMESSRRIDGG